MKRCDILIYPWSMNVVIYPAATKSAEYQQNQDLSMEMMIYP